jgi:hypothetical protein|tara:strand:- start:856 stop:1452 length:597 start_codon:yes stop_codon:yes gene_type:complete
MKQQVKLYKIKGNPRNPRIIKDDKFKKLVKSIKDFPEMLEKRPIIVDEELMVLGGNMRLKASAEAGLKEVWIDVAEGWTQEQKDEFVVKDNVNFGEWDWAMLGNEWNTIKMTEWGLDVWENQDDKNNLDAELEWSGMPEFKNDDLSPARQVIVSFKTEEDVKLFSNLLNQEITSKTKSFWFPKVEDLVQKDKMYSDES